MFDCVDVAEFQLFSGLTICRGSALVGYLCVEILAWLGQIRLPVPAFLERSTETSSAFGRVERRHGSADEALYREVSYPHGNNPSSESALIVGVGAPHGSEQKRNPDDQRYRKGFLFRIPIHFH